MYKPNIRRISFLLAAAVVSALFFSTSALALSIGEKVPDFTLPDTNGKEVSLGDFRGRKVILNFWATWCPPCRSEMPEFNRLDAELKETKEAVLLAINLTDGMRETKSKVKNFLKSNNYKMHVLLDAQNTAADIFSIHSIPMTMIIDTDGVLRGQIIGATTGDKVMKIVRGIK